MTLEERQQMYVDFLKEEGFEASVNKEGDVMFLHEDYPFYIIVDEEEEEFFQLLFPAIVAVTDEDNKAELYTEIFNINASVKVAKLLVYNELVHASVELFCSPPENFKSVFQYSFEAIVLSVNSFLTVFQGEEDGDTETEEEDTDSSENSSN